jgi:hypothetical protein
MVFGVLNGMVVVHPAPLNNNPNGPKRQACQSFPQMRADAECRPGNRAVSPGPGLSWNNAMEHELTE